MLHLPFETKDFDHLGRLLPKAWATISPYFAEVEIFSPGTIGAYHLLDLLALLKINDFRRYLGKPLIINHGRHKRRGIRSVLEQQTVNPSQPFSFHIAGKAFDVTCSALSPDEIAIAAEDFGYTGIGIYHSAKFTHLDTRYSLADKPTIWEMK